MRIIFAGSIGRFPVGGHAWIDMQYLLGFRELGHEVLYLEECGEESWVYKWETEELTTDLAYPTAFVRQCLKDVGLGDRWIYRAGISSVGGMSLTEFQELCGTADLLVVRGVPMPLWRPEYTRAQRRVFIDVDPGFTQISLTRADSKFHATVEHCQRLFTIAQRLGAADCQLPTAGLQWIPTVSPVCLLHWPMAESSAEHFTTIMQWRSYAEVSYAGRSYGNKDKEFPRFMHLPQRTDQSFEIALTGARPDVLQAYGWNVVPGWKASRTPAAYHSFIQNSRAEFAVAKHGYVATRAGWFSDRSVCYLASGRPVLVQDTGLDWLPTGNGLLTFRTADEALEGIDALNGDYARHRQCARQLAEEYFSADRVLGELLNTAMN